MKKYATLDWYGYPTTTNGDGYILLRKAEMIINREYYPTGEPGEWPVDPETGKKLPIWREAKAKKENVFVKMLRKINNLTSIK